MCELLWSTELTSTSSVHTSPARTLPAAVTSHVACGGDEMTLQRCQHSPWRNDTTDCTADGGTVYLSCIGRSSSQLRYNCSHYAKVSMSFCVAHAHANVVCYWFCCGCAVDGDWNTWSDWGACSVTCGADGRQVRSRLCDFPPPLRGGAACDGEHLQERACVMEPCPS